MQGVIRFKGRTYKVISPEGKITTTERQVEGDFLTTITSTGFQNASGNFINGTTSTQITNYYGVTVSQTSTDIATGIQLSATSYSDFDSNHHAGRVDHMDGTFELFVYGCCGLEKHTDRQGIVTEYGYDANQRKISETRQGLTTRYTYDSAGRLVSTSKEASDGTVIVETTNTYNSDGKLTVRTNALGQEERYEEGVDGQGFRFTKTTAPNGAEEIRTSYPDGQLYSVSGNGVVNKRYEYGVKDGLVVSREITLDNEGNPASWVESAQDGQGRLICTTYSDGSQDQNFYDRLGQKIKTIDREGIATLYAYNPQGDLLESAVDINQDGVINHDGMDRIQATEKGYLTYENIPVSFQKTLSWTQDKLDAVQVLAQNYRSLDGTKSWSWDREQRLSTTDITTDGATRIARDLARRFREGEHPCGQRVENRGNLQRSRRCDGLHQFRI